MEQIKEAIEQARAGQYLPIGRIAFEINKRNGYWDKPRTSNECAVLADTELAEIVEAYRKNMFADKYDLERVDLSDAIAYKINYEWHIKDTFQAEAAGFCIRCLDYLAYRAQGMTDENVAPQTRNVGTFYFERSEFFDIMMGIKCGLFNCDVYRKSWDTYGIKAIEAFAERFKFDLWRFVELELHYNAVRGSMKDQGKIA